MSDKKLARVFSALRPIFKRGVGKKYNFSAEPFDGADGPYLILSAHTITYDMFLLPLSFTEPIRFVSSEHVLRKPGLGFVARTLVMPIVKQKGSKDITTVRNILKKLSQGEWVGLYPEGNTTFNGVTSHIGISTAKLCKAARVNVLLYTTERGYLAQPRWSRYSRKGELVGSVKRVITKEECASLSVEEIYRIILDTLYENATPVEPRNTMPFVGFHLAEYLERAFFICPSCKKMCTIVSNIDEARCTACGLHFRMDECGYMQGENLPFHTLYEWDMWQRERIKSMPLPAADEVLFKDADMDARHIKTALTTKRIGSRGTLTLYGGRLEFVSRRKTLTLPMDDIEGIALLEKQGLIVNTHGDFYEFGSKKPYSALKYMYLVNYIKQTKSGAAEIDWGI